MTAANRLDRLVSGIMIIATTTPAAQRLGKAFQTPGTVKKEYVARVRGCFPEGEVICEEPLLTIDKQIGVNVVHPEGRVSYVHLRCMITEFRVLTVILTPFL